MKIKKYLLLLIFINFITIQLFSINSVAFFNQANKFYSKGEYKKALELYQKVLDDGIISPKLYYNLGNTYFKLGKIGLARYYWEKTLKLNNDEDAQNNISVLKKRFLKDIVEDTSSRNSNYFFIYNYFSYHTILLFLIIAGIFFMITTSLYCLNKKENRKFPLLVLSFFSTIIFIYAGINFYFKNYESKYYREGIVIEKEIAALNEPSSQQGDVIFKLHEGTKVKITEERGEWYKIIAGKKIVGWVKKGKIKVL